MIVTIDGPAGAGKSSAAKALAGRLGFRYLDTGAMYRAVALIGLRRAVDWSHPQQLAALVGDMELRFDGDRLLLCGEDVSTELRSIAVTAATRYAAGNSQIRAHLVGVQRQIAEGKDMITEGRDQGTVVFPESPCKIFLTATAEERARRRLADLISQGEKATFEDVLNAQHQRDLDDSMRKVGPLVPAADAVQVFTDGLSHEQVVDRLESLVRSAMINGGVVTSP
jgi:cytidylate kinase